MSLAQQLQELRRKMLRKIEHLETWTRNEFEQGRHEDIGIRRDRYAEQLGLFDDWHEEKQLQAELMKRKF